MFETKLKIFICQQAKTTQSSWTPKIWTGAWHRTFWKFWTPLLRLSESSRLQPQTKKLVSTRDIPEGWGWGLPGDDHDSQRIFNLLHCFYEQLENNNRKQVVVLSTLQVDTPREEPNQGCIISRALQGTLRPFVWSIVDRELSLWLRTLDQLSPKSDSGQIDFLTLAHTTNTHQHRESSATIVL